MQNATLASLRNLSAEAKQRLLRLTIAGIGGGLLGYLLGEMASPGADRLYESESQIRNSTGVWFMLVVIGIGAGLVGGQYMVTKSPPTGESFLYIAPALIVGGFLSGYLAQALYASMVDGSPRVARIIGWSLAGLAGGAAASAGFRSKRRLQNGLAGGLAGGFVGGILFDPIAEASNDGASRFIGIVLIGALTALLVGVIEQARSQLWFDVVSGELKGQQLLVHEEVSRLGSARNIEIPIIGDRNIAEIHCTVSLTPPKFDCLNGKHILHNGAQVLSGNLQDGDRLQLGNTELVVNLRNGSPLSTATNPQPPQSAPPTSPPAPAPTSSASNTPRPPGETRSSPSGNSQSRPKIQLPKRDT